MTTYCKQRNEFRCYINSLSFLLLVLLFLIVKPSVEETNCENICEASGYEFSTIEIYVLHYSIFHDQCALSCASP